MEANGPKAFVIAGTIAQEDIPALVAEIDGTLVREITAVVGPSDGGLRRRCSAPSGRRRRR